MKNNSLSMILKRLQGRLADESGQALVVITMTMVLMLGFAGLVIDFGRVYIAYRQLQVSTDAATLAGANALPNSTAISVATSYSGVAGNYNALSNLTGVTMVSGYPKIKCLTFLINQGEACVAPANGNAIQVKQQVTLPLYFGSLFGTPSVTLTASSTSAMRGAVSSPYNIAIILDMTQSMVTTTDTDCGSVTRLKCALQGVQVLMQNMAPCAAGYTTCSISSNVATNSIDRVSLFAFPNVTAGTVNKEYTCPTSAATTVVYSFPSSTSTSYDPTGSTTTSYLAGSTTPTYQLTPFWSDYKTADQTSTLNSSSNLVQAVGGKSGCGGMTLSQGEGTYYAGVIYAAQGALAAEKVANPGSQNVLILLSDGDATSSSSQMSGTATNNGTYPSYKNECHQAITAASYAAGQGTRVYAVAYGSAASGCTTDSPSITPCQTMEQIASNALYFYSDYTQSGSGSTCQSASQPTSNLNQIFTDIAGDFTLARLIPDNVT